MYIAGDDTDDEIEKVLQAQKKRRVAESTSDDDTHNRDDSPVAVSAAPRPASRGTDDDVSTDEESPARRAPGLTPAALPDFFDGLTFAIAAAPAEVARMSRYVRAYGGHVRAVTTTSFNYV